MTAVLKTEQSIINFIKLLWNIQDQKLSKKNNLYL